MHTRMSRIRSAQPYGSYMSNAHVIDAERSDSGRLLRFNWVTFLCVGLVLIACGLFSIMMPAISTLAASLTLGGALAVAGVVKITQALQVKEWKGFVWQMLGGIVEVVGGILIYLNPLKGAIAITLLIALVFAIQGGAQIALALRIQPQHGWGWLLASGVIALAVSAMLGLKLPFTSGFAPATIAGISLIFAGWAYVAIAYAARKSGR